VLFTSYNLLDLVADDSPQARHHYEAVTGVIRSLGTDVLAVQEILWVVAAGPLTSDAVATRIYANV
jgi:hypothetical protein